MATVLVSGASRGLGKSLVAGFRSAGHKVFAAMRNPQGMGDVPLNVRLIPSCEEAVARVVAEAGAIDILVNNAGIHLGGPIGGLDQDRFKEVLDVNLLGAWRLTKAALPHMRSGGTVAMISSLSGLVGLPDDGAYAASKFGLEGLSQSLAAELAPAGLRVRVFEPGRIDTGFACGSGGMAADAAAQAIIAAIAAPETPFRTPIGADADALFDRLAVDRGTSTRTLVSDIAGQHWL